MKLHHDEWQEINRLEAEIGRIFDSSERLDTEFGMFPIPACCFVGYPGYDRIVELRKQLQQIKKNGSGPWSTGCRASIGMTKQTIRR
jgi:hypothetical protein